MEEFSKIQKELQDFLEQISEYKMPEELFGKMEGRTKKERLEDVKTAYKKLALKYNADKLDRFKSGSFNYLSKEIMIIVNRLYAEADERIDAGTYGNGDRSGKSFSVINVGKREYRILELLARKDLADIYRGEFVNGKTPEPVWIKMARNRNGKGRLLDSDTIEFNNHSVINEMRMLKYLDSIKDETFQKVRKLHFPHLLDAFEFNDADESAPEEEDDDRSEDYLRQALALKHFEGHDFLTLKEKFPEGVPLYHGCWILERVLSVAGHLHVNNMLHGNINPSAIYVVPQIHNVIIGDFSFSIVDFNSSGKRYIGSTPFYTAPEVNRDLKPYPGTDMFSIGMSMLYLLGGNVEKNTLPESFAMIPGQRVNAEAVERIRYFLTMFTAKPKIRLDDAWKAYGHLKELRREAFGKPNFTEFKIPKKMAKS